MRWIMRAGSMVTVIGLCSAGLARAEQATKEKRGDEVKIETERHEVPIGSEGYTPELRRVSELENMKVVTERGEDFGTIEDMIIDVDHGRIAYAVISHGGVLGIGDKDALLPFVMIRGDRESTKLRTTATIEQFKQSEGFDEEDQDQVRHLSDAEFAERFHRQFDVRPYWEEKFESGKSHEKKMRSDREGATEGAGQAARERERTSDRPDDKAHKRGPGEMVLVSTLFAGKGADVKTKEAVDVGDLDDLMVDLHRGHIGYAIVNREDELVAENDLCAVPWELMNLGRGQPRPDLIVALPVEKIKDAPGFPDGHWPNMAQLEWNERINAYYDSTPYYVVYGYVSAEGEDDLRFAEGRKITLKGTIQQINRGGDAPQARPTTVRLELKEAAQERQSGDIATVALAPDSFLREKGLDLQEGSEITVTGWESSRAGGKIIAMRVESGGKSAELRGADGRPQWKRTTHEERRE
jgi:sporulation protein YlmC with PRC-barrel domain